MQRKEAVNHHPLSIMIPIILLITACILGIAWVLIDGYRAYDHLSPEQKLREDTAEDGPLPDLDREALLAEFAHAFRKPAN